MPRERGGHMAKLLRFAAAIGLAAVLGGAARAQEPDFSKVEIKVSKVSDNIYMLVGEGGNIAASVGEDGIVIVDDQFAPLAAKIQTALKNLKITDKPVRFVINTHYHGDHTGGNLPFANSGSTLIAQDNVRKRLEDGGTAGNGPGRHVSHAADPQERESKKLRREGLLPLIDREILLERLDLDLSQRPEIGCTVRSRCITFAAHTPAPSWRRTVRE